MDNIDMSKKIKARTKLLLKKYWTGFKSEVSRVEVKRVTKTLIIIRTNSCPELIFTKSYQTPYIGYHKEPGRFNKVQYLYLLDDKEVGIS